MTALLGRSLGRFELQRVDRRRRSSTTYRAVAEGRVLSVTVLPRVVDPVSLASLSAEAERLARLRHPNIAFIEETGEEDGYVYLVSEYAGPRQTLADLARPLAPAMAVRLVVPLLFALEHAHRSGIVHGDVTPRRVVLPSPVWPVLTDFALGREPAGAHPPAGRAVLATPAYLAPEQAFGLPAGPRTDLYSTAVVLYELLTGTVPFTADTPEEVMRCQAYEPPLPLRDRVATPAALERMVLEALAKDPSRRPGSAAEFASGLRAALGGPERRAVPTARGGESPGEPPASPTGGADLPGDPPAGTYAAGVAAFAQRHWEEAVALLSAVADVDPDYEDVEALLTAARSAIEPVAGN